MKILVTGGSGFLGSHVADALSGRGHEVTLFDVKPSVYRRPGQEMVVGSVLDVETFSRAIEGCEAVYHLAAVADIDDAKDSPRQTVEVNILGTLNALELSRLHGVGRFVFASSIYVYSDHGSFYRTSKRSCELLTEDYRDRYGLSYTILRFGSLYGPRADNHNSIYRLLSQALRTGRISYAGTGEEVREYINVLDAADAAAAILEPHFANENISLTGRERMKTREMLEMIREIMGGRVDIDFEQVVDNSHYTQTPYSYTPKLGKKLVRESYIDLGLGILDCLQEIDGRHGNGPEEIALKTGAEDN